MKTILGEISQKILIAVIAVVIASLIRDLFLSSLENKVVWITFYPAVMLAALFGGFFTGLLTAMLTCLVVIFGWQFFYTIPFIINNSDWISLFVFLFNCLLVSIVAEYSRKQKEIARKNHQKAEESLEKYRLMSEKLEKLNCVYISINEELKQANKRLLEMDQLKSIFLASMSHELRTPLNSIIGYTGIMLMGMSGELNEEQKKQLGKVKNNSKHLLDLINDILDISKIEAGRVELNMANVPIGEIVNQIIETMRPLIKDKDISLFSTIPEDIIITTDERRIKQVLMNLISNAVKFTDRGSVSVHACQPENNQIKISVVDTGIGLSKEGINKLFQPFQQVDSSLTKKNEGTGLGLYLSKKLIDLLGGNITVKSEPAKGSEFAIIIPFANKKKQT